MNYNGPQIQSWIKGLDERSWLNGLKEILAILYSSMTVIFLYLLHSIGFITFFALRENCGLVFFDND